MQPASTTPEETRRPGGAELLAAHAIAVRLDVAEASLRLVVRVGINAQGIEQLVEPTLVDLRMTLLGALSAQVARRPGPSGRCLTHGGRS